MSREIEKAVCSTAHTETVTFEMKPKHGAVWASGTLVELLGLRLLTRTKCPVDPSILSSKASLLASLLGNLM